MIKIVSIYLQVTANSECFYMYKADARKTLITDHELSWNPSNMSYSEAYVTEMLSVDLKENKNPVSLHFEFFCIYEEAG